MKSLTQLGFTNRFYFGDGLIKSTSSPKSFLPKDLQIVEYHRFKDITEDGSLHTVYALRPQEGVPGLFVHKYRPSDSLKIVQFLDRVPVLTNQLRAIR